VFHLHEDLNLNVVKDEFTIIIDEAEYAGGKFIAKPPPPKLGEDVEILVPKTKFNIRPFHVDQWISRFGTIESKAKYIEAKDLPGITTDDIVVVARLRKHVPGILPAFGRKMMVRYPGQPIVCNQCFQPGHLRSKCENAKVEWAAYVKVFVNEKVVPVALIGEWKKMFE